MEEKTIAIESVLVIPRNQFYWSYRLNEGAEHTIKKENVYEFLREYTSEKNRVLLADLISRFLPMMILVKEDKIIELKKQKQNIEFYRQRIEKEITDTLTNFDFNKKDNSIESKLDLYQKKYMKNE